MVTKLAITGLFGLRLIVPVFLIAAPHTADASILSLVTSLFTAKAVSADNTQPDNSQKMALLEAPVNVNVNAGSDSDVVVQGSALLADGVATDASGTFAPQLTNEITTYKVESGDTITGIAKKFGISANTIIWANGLNRNAGLKIGQNLVILPISGVQHKVAAGDTIQSIAKKYKGDVDEIISYNDLGDSTLRAGDIIVIPDGEIQTSSVTSAVKPKIATTKKPASVAAGASLTSAQTDGSGYYIRPIKGGVRTQGIHGNNGVDLAESCGSPIYASAAGKVIVSKNDGGYNGGYGNYIVISHDNGSQTLYGHMQATSVDVGATVTQGQMIGLLGNTGKVSGATGCHVHFEIRNGIRNPF